MAIVAGQKVGYVFGTAQEFETLKTSASVQPNELYFITDTKQIYVGQDLYTGQVSFVATFPETPSQGIIYVNTTTHETKVWNGTSWNVMIPPISGNVSTASDTDLVNAKAIKDYITAINGDLVTDITYSESEQKFTITYAGEETSEIQLKNLITGAQYDGASGNFTFTTANGEPIVVNTPVENFLASASYDDESHVLTLTLEDGTDVTVNLEDLIDAYTVKSSATVELQMSGNQITANVKKSATEKNALVLESDGLFVPEALVKSVGNTATANVSVSGAGQLTASVNVSANAGNQIQSVADGLFVPATDLTNYYNKTEVDNKLNTKADKATTLAGYGITDAYTKTQVDAFISWKAMS